MSIEEWLNDPSGDGNAEAAANNPSKRKRGRPKVTDPGWDAIAPQVFGLKSSRTYRNRFYAQRAINVLDETKGKDFSYLISETFTRRGVLAELGRLSDDEQLREAAIAICELKPKIKEAGILIRQGRTGESAPSDPTALANEITE